MKPDIYNFSPELLKKKKTAEEKIRPYIEKTDEICEYNSQKVLKAFSDNFVSESHLIGTTGYGYGDRGRDTLDKVYAQVFGAEDALVRHGFVSGTHAITTVLFGMLRPSQTMLSITGAPYDTLEEVIGIKGSGMGSLKDFGINYAQVDLLLDGTLNTPEILKEIKNTSPNMVYLQRSRGYSLRPSIDIATMEALFLEIRKIDADVPIVVDNCYGEFAETSEPTDVGADLIVGSLIKNPGGGIARTGGYIAGKKEYVEKCAYRFSTPGTGKDVGPSLDENKNMFLGFFLAPTVTASAIKTAIFASALFSQFGFEVMPKTEEKRTDIIQAIALKDEKKMISFCKGIQSGAPIDSFASPEPWEMPGYTSKVIMAAGAFHMGASIELSADAPLREPFAVWLQGGITYATGKTGVLLAAQNMIDEDQI